MVSIAVKERRIHRTGKEQEENLSGDFVAFCPGCKAFETISLDNAVLTPTAKYSQKGDRVFHSCGSEKPVRVYRCS
jgi:hypothetical protein